MQLQTSPQRCTRRQVALEYKQLDKEKQALQQCESYRRLVCQQAWRAWRILPAHVKAWIQIDDLINHGMWLTYKYITKKYDPSRSKSITTGLVHLIHNVFIYDYIAVYGSWKRGWEKTKDGTLVPLYMNSLEGMQETENETGRALVSSISDLITPEDPIVDNAITRCFVIPTMEKLYAEASPELKNEIVQWFWYKSLKVHTKGKPFQKMAKEFRQLAGEFNLECDDCLHLMRSPDCLDTLARTIFGVPYDHTCSPVVN